MNQEKFPPYFPKESFLWDTTHENFPLSGSNTLPQDLAQAKASMVFFALEKVAWPSGATIARWGEVWQWEPIS